MTDDMLPESVGANVAGWTQANAQYTDRQADGAWQPQELAWGVFGVREDSIGSPLGDVAGLDVVELGCGTAYFSAHLAHRGAHGPVSLATHAWRCAQAGWREVRHRGSHRQLQHPTKIGTVTVAGNPSDEVPRGTYRSILRQAGMDGDQDR